MKIGTRIAGSKVIMMAFLMALGVTTYLADRETAELLDKGLSRLQSITSIQEDILESQRRYRRSMRTLQTANRSNSIDSVSDFKSANTLRRKVEAIFKELSGLPDANQIAEEFELNYSALKTTHDMLISALRANDAAALNMAYQNWQNAQTSNELILTDMVAMAKIRLDQDYGHIKLQHKRIQLGILAILALSIVYILLVTRHFLATLVMPLKYLSSKAKDFAEGKRDVLTAYPFQDEIGSLSRNMRNMQIQVIEAEKKLKSVNEKLERFAAVAAHDLKSPLTTGLGLLDLLVHEVKGTPNASRHVARARKVLARTVESIDSLLVLSSGSDENLTCEYFDCEETVRDVLEDLDLEISTSNATISCAAEGQLFADKGLFRELLRNLVTNSIKYSRQDSPPQISISLRVERFEDRQYDALVVEDNGIGIDTSTSSKMLKPFSRGASREVKKISGVGLGLAVCDEILQAHKGHLIFEASPRGGTIAKALFIKEKNGAYAQRPAEAPVEVNMPSLAGKRAMLVDDDPHVRLIVGLHLTKLGMEVTKSKNGKEALRVLREDVPDVVITDLQMPVCDGNQLLRSIMDLNLKVPVIALSGECRASERSHFMDAGFSDCIQKRGDTDHDFSRYKTMSASKRRPRRSGALYLVTPNS